jgi:plastocyanin
MKGTSIVHLPFTWKRMAPVTALALAGSLLLPGTSLAATKPALWRVDVGSQSADEGRQLNFFFNRDISVNVGDTVQWTQAANEIHTVTFVVGTPPSFLDPRSGGPDFDGTATANSGLLDTPGQQFDLTFTRAGVYNYVCLVHEKMTGVIHVQPQGRAYPRTQAQYDAQSRVQRATYGVEATTLQTEGLVDAIRERQPQVTAGIGRLLRTGSLAVMRFEPSQKVIRAGQTVTWKNQDPETPHTVTFGTEPTGGPFASATPSGTDGPAHATLSSPTQSVNSGFVSNNPVLPSVGGSFAATFTTPGTYAYICALHDDLGMVGTITVLPK